MKLTHQQERAIIESMTPALRLAQLAIAYERALAVYFPSAAKEMAELASAVMAEEGLKYWISPDGPAITCYTCRLTSRNPNDVEHRYCGFCHKFHDAPA